MGYLGKNLKGYLKFLITKKRNIIIPDKVKSVKTSIKRYNTKFHRPDVVWSRESSGKKKQRLRPRVQGGI